MNSQASGANDGSSWANAFLELSVALQTTQQGDSVWVAAGVYRPSLPGSTRTATFTISDGLRLYGGFTGTELDLDQRMFGFLPETILSGDLAQNDETVAFCEFPGDCIPLGGNVVCSNHACVGLPNRAENSFHVVTTVGVGPETIIDGFIITGGAANSWAIGHVNGGGVFNDNGSPQFIRCTFRGNFAYQNGGGVFNGSGNPTFVDCFFLENEAAHSSAGKGGGVFNAGGSPQFSRCWFLNNSVGHAQNFFGGGEIGRGGGFHNGDGQPVLTDCIFSANKSYRQGGGLYHAGGFLTLNRCIFYRNWCGDLGGAGLWLKAPALISDCLISGNQSATVGGGAFASAKVDWVRCNFEENESSGAGGGVYQGVTNTSPFYQDCMFRANISEALGGGMYCEIEGADVTLRDCTFTDNSAERGGGLYNKRDRLSLTRCRLINNQAHATGGAIENRDAEMTLANCILEGNHARRGGAIFTIGNPLIRNCTLVGNGALDQGAGIFSDSGKPEIQSSILWNNCVDQNCDHEAEIFSWVGGPSVLFSCVQGWPQIGFREGNISIDPMFMELLDGGLTDGRRIGATHRLDSSSPCINSGDPGFGAAEEVDMDGRQRLIGCRVDMGAYESLSEQEAGDFSSDDQIDLIDVAFFQTCFHAAEGSATSPDACLCVFDMDHSTKVDLKDWQFLKPLIGGPR